MEESSGSGMRGRTGHRTRAGRTAPAWGLGKRRKSLAHQPLWPTHTTPNLERIKQGKKKIRLHKDDEFPTTPPCRPCGAHSFLDSESL